MAHRSYKNVALGALLALAFAGQGAESFVPSRFGAAPGKFHRFSICVCSLTSRQRQRQEMENYRQQHQVQCYGEY